MTYEEALEAHTAALIEEGEANRVSNLMRDEAAFRDAALREEAVTRDRFAIEFTVRLLSAGKAAKEAIDKGYTLADLAIERRNR